LPTVHDRQPPDVAETPPTCTPQNYAEALVPIHGTPLLVPPRRPTPLAGASLRQRGSAIPLVVTGSPHSGQTTALDGFIATATASQRHLTGDVDAYRGGRSYPCSSRGFPLAAAGTPPLTSFLPPPASAGPTPASPPGSSRPPVHGPSLPASCRSGLRAASLWPSMASESGQGPWSWRPVGKQCRGGQPPPRFLLRSAVARPIDRHLCCTVCRSASRPRRQHKSGYPACCGPSLAARTPRATLATARPASRSPASCRCSLARVLLAPPTPYPLTFPRPMVQYLACAGSDNVSGALAPWVSFSCADAHEAH